MFIVFSVVECLLVLRSDGGARLPAAAPRRLTSMLTFVFMVMMLVPVLTIMVMIVSAAEAVDEVVPDQRQEKQYASAHVDFHAFKLTIVLLNLLLARVVATCVEAPAGGVGRALTILIGLGFSCVIVDMVLLIKLYLLLGRGIRAR